MSQDKIPIKSKILAARRIIAYLPNLNAAVRHFTTFNFENATISLPPSILVGLNSTNNISIAPKTSLLYMLQDATFIDNQEIKFGNIDWSLSQQIEEQVTFNEEDKVRDLNKSVLPSSLDNLECLAVECDDSLKKDFRELIADRDIAREPLSIITLSQKTTNNMSAWSPEVEEEREQLLERFITSATDICDSLRRAGYWADFIDPESGRMYHASYSPSTMFETDHRYRKLGFTIHDLGCCKVIHHKIWGAFVYVGSLFTNAPIDHPVIERLQQYNRSEQPEKLVSSDNESKF